MARAIEHAFDTGEHLLVQAGTGTGKSLGYLAPALAHLHENPRGRVIVATATLALQAQLANSDIPAALDAAEKVTGRRATAAILKGRTNYACLHRAIEGTGAEQDSLLGGEVLAEGLRSAKADTASVIGAEVVALREWVQTELDADGAGDRDDAPTHTAAAWAQVSVPVRECLGQQCAFFEACFVERSRETARNSQLVVTNHALLAIDAMHGNSVLPEHDFLVIDEAHELTSRVTGAASHELSPQQVERVARRCLPLLDDDDLAVEFLDLGDALQQALDEAPLERIEDPDSPLIPVLQRIREVSRAVVSELKGDDPDRKQAAAAAKEVFDVAEAMAALKPTDVLWVSERERFGRWLVVAPLDVAGLLREGVLSNTTTVLTSATLKLGGDFESIASSVGLHRGDRLLDTEPEEPTGLEWRALDVGSPFDYARQGILYVAQHLPNPGRDGIGPEALAEVAELVWAAGGRTLGLFASQRNAEAAARHCRTELPKMTILCQGDAQLSELTRRFIDEPETSLFGTLSLWQGVDVPGDTCQLVIIDKIPFPRPDEPLLQARQKAVAQAGGNGFMAVAATHAALLLAQGSGRLIRRLSDRGVVAVLDPRLRKARYGSFLRASMPGFWSTTDREVAVNALRRLAGD
ncbi:ATP-dependent DNA helicase [Propioniciclava sp. MC1595]|uniref:ATP-dependent DNA helicase n=1 Tax=Propioniciclava sp. MC1595 TaxID=2760308 RepID=UPI0016624378|nr:ATP-dependent DNA helicase [Propioniciclava sp. MC1595]MBB1494578.1 ATP-dependent DNA helicase [Propioniciclava sp. MC1595]QTE27618.1 ATP-dependent DNA helicase [Propioniciclava sp. MC1595]